MSQNSDNGTAKPSARDKLRIQRERDKASERRRRSLKVGGLVVGGLALATVVSVTLAGHRANSGDDGDHAGHADNAAKPVMVGPRNAPAKLTVYEDFRCPACGQFENAYRDTIKGLERAGKLRAEYHLVSLIDSNMGGRGSHEAANAAACARDRGKFAAYHDVLYRNQPAEEDDAFAATRRLIQLAEKVDGLSGPEFSECVTSGRHAAWVKSSDEEFRNSNRKGTPTVLLNGKDILGDQSNPLTPAKLKQLVEAET
jgi:protein-disulfide isomerase